MRYAPFVTRTHGVPLTEPTADAERLAAAALLAFGQLTVDRPVRLLGVRAELAR